MTPELPPEWETSIAEVGTDSVTVRGYDLDELIGNVTFTDMAFLVLVGRLPDPRETKMLDALLVSVTEHGISPSTIIVRMLASCGTPLQAGIAGAALSIADWHGGAGEQLAQFLSEAVSSAGDDEGALRESLAGSVAEYRRDGRRLEGFGHPQHPEGDPRACRLLGMQRDLGLNTSHTRALELIAVELEQSLGRQMKPNVNGALASITLDLGLPWRSIRGLVVAPRTFGLTAHFLEELEQGGRWRHASAEKVRYTGEPQRPLERRS